MSDKITHRFRLWQQSTSKTLEQGNTPPESNSRPSQELPCLKKDAERNEAPPESSKNTLLDKKALERKGGYRETMLKRSNSSPEESPPERDDPEGGVSIYTKPSNSKRPEDNNRKKSKQQAVKRSGDPNPLSAKYARLSTMYKEQSSKLSEALGTISEKEEQINNLTATITRLHQRDGEADKSDEHFAMQFSDIYNSIVQWIVTHFRSSAGYETPSLPMLSEELQKTIGALAYQPEAILENGVTRRGILTSIVVEAFRSQIFDIHIFGALGATDPIKSLKPMLQGTVFQRQRWRALTSTMIAKGDKYEEDFAKDVNETTRIIGELIEILAHPASDKDHRNNELHELVKVAGRLSVEIRRQADNIRLESIKPGTPYNASTMEDINCQYEEHELEDGGLVDVTTFPVILRRGCGPDGSLWSEPCVVMKAKVMAIIPNPKS